MFTTASSPESQGIPSRAILNFLKRVDSERICMHGFLLVRHNRIAVEGYWAPWTAKRKHRMYSVSKSFVALAVGLMIDEGRLATIRTGSGPSSTRTPRILPARSSRTTQPRPSYSRPWSNALPACPFWTTCDRVSWTGSVSPPTRGASARPRGFRGVDRASSVRFAIWPESRSPA